MSDTDKSGALDAFDWDCQSLKVDQNAITEVTPRTWQADILFSYPDSENVAEGDLEEDIATEFRALMEAKNIYDVKYEFHVLAGGLHANPFCLRPHIVAMIAVLGGSVFAHSSDSRPSNKQEAEQAAP
ncbi:hypothetical protein V2O64_18445 [Verrucomicrobiaceae bacterium 227]